MSKTKILDWCLVPNDGAWCQTPQELINAKAAEGWELMQIISPNDLGGAMIGLFCREEE